ncbi:hypothetical protein BHE74_00022984 [Ensete ventricosum]|nr:hypothetical protein BHE74_00022984 [Ensete ventricosum]
MEVVSSNTLSFDRCSDGTVPCITLILGGNLTQGKKSLSFCNLHAHESIIHLKASETCAGLRKSVIRPVLIVAIVCVRYVILPAFGIAVVKAAYGLGFVPYDPLYRYVLMVQFGLPPAMSIGKKAPSLFSSTCFVERKGFQGDEHNCAGTMAQLFDVGQEECSVIFLWTYLIAAVSLTWKRRRKKMGFWSLFPVASTPIVQVLLIGLLGAYLASGYSNLLPPSARRDMNKVNCSSYLIELGNQLNTTQFLCLLEVVYACQSRDHVPDWGNPWLDSSENLKASTAS